MTEAFMANLVITRWVQRFFGVCLRSSFLFFFSVSIGAFVF